MSSGGGATTSVASDGWTEGDGSDGASVRVCVRVRPFVPKEKVEGCQDCTRLPSGSHEVVIGNNRRFTFDKVYGPASSQEEVRVALSFALVSATMALCNPCRVCDALPCPQLFTDYVSPLVDGCFQGFNATVLAYGQTGSGKTYTMGTGSQANMLQEELGVVPRVLDQVR